MVLSVPREEKTEKDDTKTDTDKVPGIAFERFAKTLKIFDYKYRSEQPKPEDGWRVCFSVKQCENKM